VTTQSKLAALALLFAFLHPPSSSFAQGALTPPGAPAPTMKSLAQVEPRTGYIYTADVGWISLSNSFAVLQTDSLSPGPLDANGSGLPIAWEKEYFGSTKINANADPDGDGMSNLHEYLAGTNPTDPKSNLRITAVSGNPLGSTATLTWTSVPSRLYQVEERTNLTINTWATNVTLGVVSPDLGSTTVRHLTDAAAVNRFFRVQAIVPLSP
jgi:hypothetical protein